MKPTAAVITGCTAGTFLIGGERAMHKQFTATTYSVDSAGAQAGDLVAVLIDGEIRVMDRETFEDLDDLRASKEAMRDSGSSLYSEFRKELDL
jgi:hypothetical protein